MNIVSNFQLNIILVYMDLFTIDENFYKLIFIGSLTGATASFVGGGAEILIVPLLVYMNVIYECMNDTTRRWRPQERQAQDQNCKLQNDAPFNFENRVGAARLPRSLRHQLHSLRNGLDHD